MSGKKGQNRFSAVGSLFSGSLLEVMAIIARFRRRKGFSLRSKFLVLVLAIFTLPWMGVRYVNEMKRFLLQGQEDALLLTAKAVGTVLNDRDELFRPDTGVPELLGGRYDLYAHQLQNLLQLDGDPVDWGSQLDSLRDFTGSLAEECTAQYNPFSLSIRHTLGYRNQFLYALFLVDDDVVVYRDIDLRNLDHSDQLRLTIQNLPSQILRYLLLAKKDGRMSVYLMDEEWRYPLTGEPVSEINAVMKETAHGFNVEIRLPRFMVRSSSRVGFEVVDVDDDQTREIKDIITTYPKAENLQLSRVMIHSPELAKILGGLDRQVARTWILDAQKRVRAVVGSLGSTFADGISQDESVGMLKKISNSYNALFDKLLNMPSPDFQDIELDTTHRSDVIIDEALKGNPHSRRRLSVDNRAEILAAAHPIWSGSNVIGAVIVEQSSAEVLKLQNQALRSVAAVTLVAFLFITLTIFIFATRLTIRIRKLHLATEQSITSEGRVRKEYVDAFQPGGGDEIGVLSGSITGMLGRLSEYTRYLEAMPDTLAHELNNPLYVVSSSLEILARDSRDAAESKYMKRAQKGIQRLRSILTSLTEAANLEDALQYEDNEEFDLVELVEGCTEGYQMSFPKHHFELHKPSRRLLVSGAPDRIAQLLDKLIDNAIDFSDADTEISISLAAEAEDAVIRVKNTGSTLPEEMKERLFDPMVSVGRKDATQSHLGLGLFVVRIITEYHHGEVSAENQHNPDGVCLTIRLPRLPNRIEPSQ